MRNISYFNKANIGGSISSAGMSFQDCCSIIYLFKYLDCESFEEITFETTNDFTIRFSNEKEISVQVKVNQLTIKKIIEFLKKYNFDNNKRYIIIGSGFDDEFRNFYNKLLRYKNIINSRAKYEEKAKATTDFENECKSKKINFENIKFIEFDAIDKINALKIVKSEIYEWADRRNLFIDVNGILNELETNISLQFREYGESLSKEKIMDIIWNNKQSKITSRKLNMKNFDDEKKFFINEIEKYMIKSNILFKDLQILKSYIEEDMFKEALNKSTELAMFNINLKIVHLWILLNNQMYFEIISICKNINLENYFLFLILGKAYIGIGDFQKAIEILKLGSELQDDYNINLQIGIASFNLKDKVRALEYFNKCKYIEPKKGEIYLYIGKLFEYKEECIEYMDKALYYNPNLFEAYIEKGKVFRYKSKFNQAKRCYEKYMELSGEYDDIFILTEIALCSYMLNDNEMKVNVIKWISIFNQSENKILFGEKEKISIVDCGENYINYILITKKENKIALEINGKLIASVYKDSSTSGIGLEISPTNRELLVFSKYGEDIITEGSIDIKKIDIEYINEEASLPTIYKLFSDAKNYEVCKRNLLNEDVLVLNHQWDGYLEYIDNKDSVKVNIYKKIKSLNIEVKIGNHSFIETFSIVGEGFHEFRRKCQQKSMFNEAAILLKSPNEECQITFDKSNILIFDS